MPKKDQSVRYNAADEFQVRFSRLITEAIFQDGSKRAVVYRKYIVCLGDVQ